MNQSKPKQARRELKSGKLLSTQPQKKKIQKTSKGVIESPSGDKYPVKGQNIDKLMRKMQKISQQLSNQAASASISKASINPIQEKRIQMVSKALAPRRRALTKLFSNLSNPIGCIRRPSAPLMTQNGLTSAAHSIPMMSLANIASTVPAHVGHGDPVVIEKNPADNRALNPPVKAASGMNIHQNALDYAFAILEPERASMMNTLIGYGDGTIRPTYKFWTYQNLQLSTAVNGSTNDCWIVIAPQPYRNVTTASAFAASLPSAYTYYDNPSYSTLSTWVDFIRCVSIGAQLRNLTVVQNQSGVCLQGTTRQLYTYSSTWSNLAQSRHYMTRTLANPGDVGRVAWTPVSGVGVDNTTYDCSDSQWKAYNATVQSGDTEIHFWTQSPVAQTFLLTVHCLWEVLVIPSFESVYNPTVRLLDNTEAAAAIMAEYAKSPATALERNVFRDDGIFQTAISEAKDLVGGAIGSLLSSIKQYHRSRQSGLFGDAYTSEDRLERVLSLITDKDIAVLYKTLLDLNDGQTISKFPNVFDLRKHYQNIVTEQHKATPPPAPIEPEFVSPTLYELDEIESAPVDSPNQDDRKVYFETEFITVREQLPDGTLGPSQTLEKKIEVDLEDQFVRPQPIPPSSSSSKFLSSGIADVTFLRDGKIVKVPHKFVDNSSTSSWQQINEPPSPTPSTTKIQAMNVIAGKR